MEDEGRARRRGADALGLHLPWQTVSSIFSTSTCALVIVWQKSASTDRREARQYNHLMRCRMARQSVTKGRTEHLIRLPEAERQRVGLHQALVRLGPLLTHAVQSWIRLGTES